MKRGILKAALLLLTCCSSAVQQRNDALSLSPTDEPIVVALLRYAINDLRVNGLRASVCCVEVQGHVAPPRLLAQLGETKPPVRGPTDCKKEKEPVPPGEFRVVERATGEPAALLSVAITKRLDPEHVEASFGWEQAGMASRTVSLRMHKVGDHWTIEEQLYSIQS